MKQFIAILLPIIIICFNTLFAQDRNLVIPVRAAVTEDLNPPYTGRGWHRVHKRPVKKLLAKSPSRKTNICPDCHKKNAYRVNDPHTQLSEGGDIIKEKCLYCHPEKPDEKSATFTVLRPEIKFNRDLKELCLGCHSRQYDFSHPVNANHLLIPSDEMLSMMKASEAQFGVILPLNFNGEIMCATCHNPHERGVIPAEKAASRGASEKFRVRLIGQARRVEVAGANTASADRPPRETDKICLTCHKDKGDEKGGIGRDILSGQTRNHNER